MSNQNNHNDHSTEEPAECPLCFSSLTETTTVTSRILQCDECSYQNINGEDVIPDFDEVPQEHVDLISAGRVMALEMLLKEIALNKLTEICQVKALIKSKIEHSKGEQYAADANADHVTGQIPNV